MITRTYFFVDKQEKYRIVWLKNLPYLKLCTAMKSSYGYSLVSASTRILMNTNNKYFHAEIWEISLHGKYQDFSFEKKKIKKSPYLEV